MLLKRGRCSNSVTTHFKLNYSCMQIFRLTAECNSIIDIHLLKDVLEEFLVERLSQMCWRQREFVDLTNWLQLSLLTVFFALIANLITLK